MSRISSWNCIEVEVGREILEHWARFTSLKIVDELGVLIVSVHSLKSSNEIICVKIRARESNETWSTMIEETQEDLWFAQKSTFNFRNLHNKNNFFYFIVSTGFESSTVSTVNGSFVVGENSKIVSRCNSITFIIDDATSIDIDTR